MKSDLVPTINQWQKKNNISNSEFARRLKITKSDWYSYLKDKQVLIDLYEEELSIIMGINLSEIIKDRPWKDYFEEDILEEILSCKGKYILVDDDTRFIHNYYRSIIGRMAHILTSKQSIKSN